MTELAGASYQCKACGCSHGIGQCPAPFKITRTTPHAAPSARLPKRIKFIPARDRAELLKQIVTDLHDISVREYRADQLMRRDTIEGIVRKMHRELELQRAWKLKRVSANGRYGSAGADWARDTG